ncbi:16S rRNA (adenine(1518)-N(6)/adenine(1519)-N(6))-dimethyltransferase [Alsobacter soli]|uniref:Ribosomal RNA small subunit methyltransferase A n=1 Tax=Alsobacter soli TaxID=2109933 RepID=A0A2T1HW06_9HYPH|nr:16S rRNA (adenine(1518)-N(6)/adenine(1519)-N(6))-dimethyltransferase RsmA [Alsobacter soli]PSC05689.1 16S rRNA (adenine(1518)-N(6)/adenine(1519)-N(6))-dimethyltransferase [Alsobacter soli]
MSAIDDLPPLRDVIREHDLAAKKSLGQNFLLDLNLTSKIARASGPLEGVTVFEVGPGPGGLTRALLACGAAKVVAVERDERCLPALAAIAARYPGRLTVIPGDALETNWNALAAEHRAAPDSPVRVVANLPYNIGTLLLTHWVEAEPWPPFYESLTLMFQREVAERIVATTDNRIDYGRLGVLCGWRTKARILFDVPPSAFTPPPKVTSSVVQLVPRPDPLPCSRQDLSAVTAAAFGQRRKMLRQSLKPLASDPAPLLEAAGLDPTARAETVPIEGFVALARAFRRRREEIRSNT